MRIPPILVVGFGIVAAAGVGYLTAENPAAQPAGVGVPLRVLIIGTLALAAAYAQTSALQERMGLVLTGACVLSAFWLLNGSADSFAFSVGLVLSGPAFVAAYYVMLMHPTAASRPRAEVRFVAMVGGAGVLIWILATLTSQQPPLRTPLLACSPHCPHNLFFLGFTLDGAMPTLKIALRVVWLGLTFGMVVLLERRWRSASGPLRRPLLLVWLAACLAATLLLAFLIAQRSGTARLANAIAVGYIVIWAVIPVAILVGLATERLFLGEALARFVSQLANDQDSDPGPLMATTLQHPSLSIAYVRPVTGALVDFSGAPVANPENELGREVTWIERDGRPVAAVTYDCDLADQRRFIQAAADVAVMRLQQAQLLADLRASTADLTASRLRLVETAQAERQRIERDLHDSIQQDILGVRLRLALASETIRKDPAWGQQMIAAVGAQLDQVLDALRTLAHGIYPSVLQDHGLVEAVRSAARRSPVSVSVRAGRIGRYKQDVEVAVYFCCLEAVQNIIKHAGPSAHGEIRFWHDAHALRFEIADSGAGFDSSSVHAGNGVANMRDRLDAIGGTLTITSRRGEGTLIQGRVPIDATASVSGSG